MHTLNLRLAADEIGWIAAHAQDRFLIVDDILLPLYKQFAKLPAFEKVIVFPFSGAPVPGGVERRAAPSSTLPPGGRRRRRLGGRISSSATSSSTPSRAPRPASSGS